MMKNKELEELDLSFDQGADIVEFIKSHRFINVSQIEKEAGMSKTSLWSALIGKRKIPVKYWYVLNNILVDYGYSINISTDNPEGYQVPFKYLDIACLESGVTFSKNFDQLEEVKIFLSSMLAALDQIDESQVRRYGSEFIVKTDLLKYDFEPKNIEEMQTQKMSESVYLTVKHTVRTTAGDPAQNKYGSVISALSNPTRDIVESLDLSSFLAKYPPLKPSEKLINRITEEFKPGGRIAYNYGNGNVIFTFS